jgi:energy-converting hydrogenase Eha subunit C
MDIALVASLIFPICIVALCVMVYANIIMHRRVKRIRELAMRQAVRKHPGRRKLYVVKKGE